MAIHSYLEVLAFFVVLLAAAPALGWFTALVLSDGQPRVPILSAIERACLRGIGSSSQDEMDWKSYAFAVLIFNAMGFLLLLSILMLQGLLPWNPQGLAGVPFWLAFNTAISFVTNTNWQAYSGESTLSYFSQMAGLTTQNFLSAATGIAVMVALARGLQREKSLMLGSFWVDMTRSVIYILLPLSLILALTLVAEGVIQNLGPYLIVQTPAGTEQVLPMGPAASQVAIKQLGTNGGGFFGVNSAHPFENPTPLSNFLQALAILLIPASLPFAFGKLVGNARHGLALFGAMFFLFVLSLGGALWSEAQANPSLGGIAFMEGKEQRIGIAASAVWSTVTTLASNGSVNSMLSSFSPLGGGLALLNILLGEVVFGGVGSGVYGMVLFAILTIFIAGLMVGRTPEYLGKKIESADIRLAVLGIVLPSAIILIFTAIAVSTDVGTSSLLNKGPHGFSEIFYAFASGAGNNGSAFAGLNAGTVFYNFLIGVAMIVGRYGVILPVIYLAGQLASKKRVPSTAGTFSAEGPLFAFLLCSVVLIVGALTFFPALCLGPVMEHLMLLQGRVF